MNDDRIWEMYHSDTYQAETQAACRQRIHWIAERARGDVLDVGCSQGLLPILLAREGHRVLGVDVEAAAIEFAKARLAEESDDVQSRVELRVADMTALQLDRQFDTVIMGEVLEHLTRPERMIERVVPLLKPDGRLVVTVPMGWLEHDDHKQAFTLSEIIDLLRPHLVLGELEVTVQKIAVVATPSGDQDPALIGPERLLALTERSLVAEQHAAADVLRESQRRGELLGELREARKKLRETSQERKRRLDDFAKRNRELKQQLQDVQSDLQATEATTSFQLGSALVEAGKGPIALLKLPLALARLTARAFRRWRARRDAEAKMRLAAVIPTNDDVYAGRFGVDVPHATPLLDPQPQRVLHLLEYSVPHHQNGYTLRARQLMKAQRELGWDPVVVTRPGFPTPGTNTREEEIDGVRMIRLPGRGLPEKPGLPDYLRTYVREAAVVLEAERPAVIHAASNFRNAYAGLQLARNYGLPFVYEVRGFWEETRIANGGLKVEDKQYRRLVEVETHCLRQADAVVTLGEAMRDEIVRRGVPRESVFLVPNGVDLDSIDVREPRADLTDRWSLEGKLVLGYLGSVTRLESLHIAVQALAELRNHTPEVVLLIVGGGTELDALQRLATDLELEDRVHFVGKVPHAEIPDYYALVDVIVCTRGRHRVCELVTPLKPLEAMGYRKPLVFSELPALAEIVAHEERGLLFKPESPPALARALRRLAKDKALTESLVEGAHEWARKERTWTAVASAYEAAYAHSRRKKIVAA